jgi:hypothetical protein
MVDRLLDTVCATYILAQLGCASRARIAAWAQHHTLLPAEGRWPSTTHQREDRLPPWNAALYENNAQEAGT